MLDLNHSQTPLTVGSICTGYAGFELALATAGINHHLSWISENNPAASTLLTERFPTVPNLGDINHAKPDNVDLICAGFPCQDISNAGHRKGIHGSRSGLWWQILDVISHLRPSYVLLENVAAILTTGGTSVIGSLTQIGYDSRWLTVQASSVGAPHQRNRWFCFAWNTQKRRRRSQPTPQPPTNLEPSRSTRRPNRTTTNTNRFGRQRRNPARRTSKQSKTERRSINNPNTRHPHTRFGRYQPAITRWEQTTRREAPAPSIDNRLNPVFVEWMMGLPAGWVTDIEIPRTTQLQILGNGIVPQQATHAIQTLTKAA